ncbi:hypothetical protein MRB53_042104 [Persea americana]|nr:hypothetical protein MRB53_042104 [Persea americana]
MVDQLSPLAELCYHTITDAATAATHCTIDYLIDATAGKGHGRREICVPSTTHVAPLARRPQNSPPHAV